MTKSDLVCMITDQGFNVLDIIAPLDALGTIIIRVDTDDTDAHTELEHFLKWNATAGIWFKVKGPLYELGDQQ